MKVDIALTFDEKVEVVIRFREEDTPTLRALASSLPFTSKVNRWGDEVYFEAPFHAELEGDARQDMDVGEVAFWPDGDALAVFFGKTPVSTTDKPRAYSPCNIVGMVVGDTSVLKSVSSGMTVRLRKSP